MSPRKKILTGSLILIFITCSVALFIIQAGNTTVITGEVFDAGNGMPVYDATISMGNRTTKTFLLKKFQLTLMPTDKAELIVTAPMYETVRIELDISKNKSLNIPLRGEKIEGLTGLLVWATVSEGGLLLDIRLTDEHGETMIHFPSMPLKASVEIYENIGTLNAPERGIPLYAGRPEIIDEPAKGLERLKCIIAINEMAKPRKQGIPSILDVTLRVQDETFRFSRYDVNISN